MISNATPKTQQPVSPQATRQARQTADESIVTTLSHDEIARVAYEIYLRSGKQEGRCTHNWNQAEQELRHQRIRDELMSQPATVVSSNERYSEVLNRRNPRGDAKLMRAIAKTKSSNTERGGLESLPNVPAGGEPQAGALATVGRRVITFVE